MKKRFNDSKSNVKFIVILATILFVGFIYFTSITDSPDLILPEIDPASVDSYANYSKSKVHKEIVEFAERKAMREKLKISQALKRGETRQEELDRWAIDQTVAREHNSYDINVC